MTDTDRGDWMQTYTGGKFYPTSPLPGDVNQYDIAHALALLNRYGGHTSEPFSVAEHCVLLSYVVSPENALWALLHDAAEAYVVDVPRPLKRQLVGYKEAELKVQACIFDHFEVADLFLQGQPDEVTDADMRILLTERNTLMPNTRYRWMVDDLEPLRVEIQLWSWRTAEKKYLSRLTELLKERGNTWV